MEREAHFLEASDRIKQQLEIAEKKKVELEEELIKTRSGSPEKDKRGDAANRSSLLHGRMRMSMMTGGMDKSGSRSMSTSEEDIDEYLNIISKLTTENANAKSYVIKGKLTSLKESTPYMSKCVEHYKRKKEADSEFSDDQNAKINSILSKMHNLNKQVKVKYSEASVVSLEDLSSKPVNEKDAFVHNYNKMNSFEVESFKMEANKLADKFIQILNQAQKKTNFKPYLSTEVQRLVNNETMNGNCVGVLSVQNQGSSDSNNEMEKAAVVVNVILERSQLEKLKNLVF